MGSSPLPEIKESSPSANAIRSEPVALKYASIGLDNHVVAENPWGYGKRLRFVTQAIGHEYPDQPPGSIRLLDVGCGNGLFLAIPLARAGFGVTGVDFHQPSIARAQGMASALPNARFVAGTVADLDESDFDVVILSEVLEHVPDPKALLLASLQRLKPNGIAVITVPNGYGEFEIDSWIFRVFRLGVALDLLKRILRRTPARPGGADQPADQPDMPATDNDNCPHVQFFNIRRLKRMFRECSLSLIEESAGSLACGPLVSSTLGHSRHFIEWNARVSDSLPLVLASSWYFVLRRETKSSL
jgi:SAM-dependent methyltransferase